MFFLSKKHMRTGRAPLRVQCQIWITEKNRQQAVEAEILHAFYSWATYVDRYGSSRADDRNSQNL